MPEADEIYDANTGQWVNVEDPDSGWNVVDGPTSNTIITDGLDDNDNDESNPESVTTTTPCDQLGKRHKYKDRQTGIIHEYCLTCGQPKPQPGSATGTQKRSGSGGTRSSKTNPLDMLLSGAWMGLGYVAGGVIPQPAGKAVSRTLRMEAAIAGPRLHKALKKTPIYPYIAIASGQFAWAADIAMLLAPPLLVGLIAMRPELKIPLRGMLTGVLVPVVAESIAAAEKQAALMEQLEKYDERTINAAMSAVDYLLGDNDDPGKGDDESEAA